MLQMAIPTWNDLGHKKCVYDMMRSVEREIYPSIRETPSQIHNYD